MKNLMYSLHSKWSLLVALFPRLWFHEEKLRRMYPDLWQYRLLLPHKDYIAFFPYIVSVGGVGLNFKNSHLSCTLRKKTVTDPINIVAYGVSPGEFVEILTQANPLWQQFLGSSHFLYGSVNTGWRSSVAMKLDINKEAKERHHIRLFELKTSRGEKVTLGAAHYDPPNHTERGAPLSWNETRDLVASRLGILCWLSEPVTRPNWRGADGDGRILIINCKNKPRV